MVTRLAANVDGQLGLARQQPAAREFAGGNLPAELAGDLLVADVTHLSYTCLHQVETPAGRGLHDGRHRIHSRRARRARVRPPSGACAALARERFGRPVTLAEKILVNHLRDPLRPTSPLESHRTGPKLRRFRSRPRRPARRPRADRDAPVHQRRAVATRKRPRPCTAITSSKRASRPRPISPSRSTRTRRCTTFLRSACAKYGIGFWQPGSGIIHQVVLENYAFPGGMMIGTDSHTPNAGGLGMIAVGVGGGDALDAMTGFPFNVRWPKLIGVHLTGSLSGWSSPKDVILRVADLLTVKGGTGAIVEYFGAGGGVAWQPRARPRSATWARRSAPRPRCSPTTRTPPRTFRRRAGRSWPTQPTRSPTIFGRIPMSKRDPERYFDQVIEIDLSALAPLINGPDTPDLAHAVSDVGPWARANGVPTRISSALIGSCTNSSYEDITRAASIARHAAAHGLRAEDAALRDAGIGAGAGDDRARRLARRPRGDRRHRARQRVRAVHRSVGSAGGRLFGRSTRS